MTTLAFLYRKKRILFFSGLRPAFFVAFALLFVAISAFGFAKDPLEKTPQFVLTDTQAEPSKEVADAEPGSQLVPEQIEPPNTRTPPSIGPGQWLRALVSLLFIVVLILVLAWALRRVQGGIVPDGSEIKVLSSRSLGGKERLVTIEVEGQRLLLAVSPAGIQKLASLDKPADATKENA